jgi:hypothetical protein
MGTKGSMREDLMGLIKYQTNGFLLLIVPMANDCFSCKPLLTMFKLTYLRKVVVPTLSRAIKMI